MTAATAAIWLVCCGVLAMRHEAHVAHVRDARTGELHHGTELVGKHTTEQSDIHGTPGHADDDACGICAAFHQAAVAAVARPLTPVPATPACVLAVRRDVAATSALLYRLAPKTSPPAAV